jgi:quercetin dioxygenase-like cupin family protein
MRNHPRLRPELQYGGIEMPDKELGDVGSYIMLENDHVRVWQNDLEPGESSDWHVHTTNYLFIATVHGDLKVEFSDSSSHAIELEVGQVTMGEKDSVHQLTNVGDTRYTSVIIELKNE